MQEILTVRHIKSQLGLLTNGKLLLECLTDYDLDAEHLEFPGDLQEIQDIIDREIDYMKQLPGAPLGVLISQTTMDKINKVLTFIEAAELLTIPPELEQIPTVKQLKTDYPQLYHTMCIWTWG